MTNLTTTDLAALSAAGFEFKDAPATIPDATRRFLGWQLFSGACRMHGHEYKYLPTTDEMVREDVLRFIEAQRRRPVVKDSLTVQPEQGRLW